ncbi:hypothetical protein C5167_044487 [Papaver somniferum]|uniref:Protein FAR1-RELATED SEQUENCE n=1 Tax=Papaver somniferum TaxID=3469 RepID=A0A4Y7L8U3_PAPSO|nr:hypothetical protein C5167_044487 [Papaver somniferum]
MKTLFQLMEKKNDELDDEIVPPNNTKELSEEEINNIRPFIGKEFESQDEAYDFYNRYAVTKGYGIVELSRLKKGKGTKLIQGQIVMKTWMRDMHGKAQKVLLTDQESAIGSAIAHVSRVGYAHKHRTVIFDSFNKSAQCSCLLYEFVGYLWRHILKVFVVENVQNLPTQHVLKRWTKDAKFGPVVFDQGEEIAADCQDMVTVRYSKLCQDATNIAVKGSTSIPVYNVAYEDITRQKEIVENHPNFRRPLKEPPIVKRKGKPGRRKSWVDALNRKRKNKEIKGKTGSGSSPRLPTVELEIANSQDKQPKKRKKKKSVALVNTNSQDKQQKKRKKSSNKGRFSYLNGSKIPPREKRRFLKNDDAGIIDMLPSKPTFVTDDGRKMLVIKKN